MKTAKTPKQLNEEANKLDAEWAKINVAYVELIRKPTLTKSDCAAAESLRTSGNKLRAKSSLLRERAGSRA